jgi:putative ABC transport system permease protein
MHGFLRRVGRTTLKQPGASALAVVMLAVGIGATTMVFSVVEAVLLRPLPFGDAERLVWLWSVDTSRSGDQFTSYPDLSDWRSRSRTIEQLAGWGGYEAVVTGSGDPERLRAALTIGDLFGVLGVPPLIGTTAAGDGDPVVVLSHGLWQRRYGGDAGLVGQGIVLNGEAHTVTGVMPAGFRFPIAASPVDAWIVLREDQFNPGLRGRRDARLIEVIGRLRPGVAPQAAQAEMMRIAADLGRLFPETNADIGVRVVPGVEQVAGRSGRLLWMLLAAIGLVLLIACVNVAHLLLARGIARQQEIGVRMALGARRRRIAWQLFVEGVPLAAVAGLLGAALAVWAVGALVPLLPGDLPRADEVAVNPVVLAFGVLVSLLTVVGFGLLPAWHASSVDVTTMLQGPGGTAAPARRRLSSLLVTGELALAMLLLGGAVLFMSTFLRLNARPAGLDPEQVLTFEVSWPSPRYSRPEAARAFQDLQTRLAALPGVASASVGLHLPDRGGPVIDEVLPLVAVEGEPRLPGERLRTSVVSVQPGFFGTLGIPLGEGRDFDDGDASGAPLVAIVNESLARAYFPGADPVGRRLVMDDWTFFGSRTLEIVGVAADVTHRGLPAGAAPVTYLPLAQNPTSSAYVVVKADGDPRRIVSGVRAAVAAVDPGQPVDDLQLLDRRIAASIATERFSASLLAAFAVLAAMLAAGGLYAVVSCVVAQRTHELGIRVALGARLGDVVGLVIRGGMGAAVAGIVLGLAGLFASTRVIESLLFGVSSSDPLAVVAAAGLLALVALAACWIPARRAARLDPLAALRRQ